MRKIFYRQTRHLLKIKLILLALFVSIANLNAFAFPTITEINPTIDSLMKQVNIDSLEYCIRYLQELGEFKYDTIFIGRFGGQADNYRAHNWLTTKYENNLLILSEPLIYQHHNFFHIAVKNIAVKNPITQKDDTILSNGDTIAGNVIALQKGTLYPDEYIIVCSHYDACYMYPISSDKYDVIVIPGITPGADDNASGTAGVIEIARILSKHKFKRSIIYINFNAEEIGLFGSMSYVSRCKNEEKNILGVFNLDMIGYNPIGKPLEIFYNDSPPINKDFAKYFNEVANLYLPEIPALPNTGQRNLEAGLGDDAVFISYDYPAMYMGDVLGSENPCYHMLCDTIGIGKEDAGVNSMELVKGYTQATLVAIAELAEYDGVGILEDDIYDISIVPNPAENDFSIIFNNTESQNISIELISIDGKNILDIYSGFASAEQHIYKVDKKLASGTYLVKFAIKGKTAIRKVIVK